MPKDDFAKLLAALDSVKTPSGQTLAQFCEQTPVLLVFLRHSGCAFCREALSDLARARSRIESAGTRILLVHMGDAAGMNRMLERFGIVGLARICDPDQRLYRAFGLRRGSLRQLLGPKVWWRAVAGGVVPRYGIAVPSADSFQMPGLFLLYRSSILQSFRHRSAADRPDYLSLLSNVRRQRDH